MKKWVKGILLAELLVGIFLTALLLSVLCPLLQVSMLSCRQQLAQTNVRQNIRHAMDAMTHELRWAISIQRPVVGQTTSFITFSRVNIKKIEEQVVFQKGASSGAHADTLYQTFGHNSPSPITEDILTGLEFYRAGYRTVQIKMIMRDRVTGIEEELSGWVECLNVPDQ